MNISRSTLLVFASVVSGAIALAGSFSAGLRFAPLVALLGFALVGLGLWKQRRAEAASAHAPSLEDSALPTLRFEDAELAEAVAGLSAAARTPWLSDLEAALEADAPEDLEAEEENARFASELRLVFPAQKGLSRRDGR